jgi:hypothetical protein
MAGDNITVTFTPQMGESLTTLTVTGDNTNLNLTNGITDNHDNTYTFAMPNENVTLGGTFTFPMNADNFAQDGDTYTIKNADGWDYFCQRIQYDANLDGFSGKTVELAANISVTTMAGIVHPFKGTFDGKDKTLTFNRTADAMYTAPFQNTNGATISNLHVEGTITGGTNSYISGLVGSANGNLTIRDCHVSTQISTTFDSNTLSANVGIGGFVGLLSSQYNQCHITGCVFDGLIYNPNYSGTTYGCGGFVGCFSQYGYAILEDCLFIEGQYDNNGGKHELLWGHDNNKNSTFFHRTNYQGQGTLKNCFFVATHFLKQGSPAVESATAPTNFAHFGDPTTDYGFLKVYGHTMVLGGKYYTPKYGDAVVEYRFNDWNERADVTINGEGNNLVGVNITEEVDNIKSVTYNRTFTSGKAATVILPFNYTCNGSEGSEGGKFYGFKEVAYDYDQHIWVCTMVEPGEEGSNNATSLTANTPYLFMPSDPTMAFPNIESMTGGVVTLQTTTANDGLYGGATTDAAWNFHGSYKGKTWTSSDSDKDYGFAAKSGEAVGGEAVEAGQFVRFTTGAFIKPMRCYLSYVGTSAPAPARCMTRSASGDDLPASITVRLVSRNGETTGIGTLSIDNGQWTIDNWIEGEWYSLDGVRLSGKPSMKGIYINNGRKVVIK